MDDDKEDQNSNSKEEIHSNVLSMSMDDNMLLFILPPVPDGTISAQDLTEQIIRHHLDKGDKYKVLPTSDRTAYTKGLRKAVELSKHYFQHVEVYSMDNESAIIRCVGDMSRPHDTEKLYDVRLVKLENSETYSKLGRNLVHSA